MRALIFADRSGTELTPITDSLPVALLPITGKELLTYSIEDLVAAGILDITIVTATRGEQASPSALGDGKRWGATIRWVSSQGQEAPSALWPRLNLDKEGSDALVVLRGDLLRTPVVEAFLNRAQSHAGGSAHLQIDDSRGGVLLLRDGNDDPEALLDSLCWDEPAALPDDGGCRVDGVEVNPVIDLPGFHRANLDMVAGRVPGLKVAGREVALGLHAGRGSKVSPKVLRQGVAWVGDNSRIDNEAELLGEVVIDDDVVIDRAATVRDSVILPKTYIGELVEVKNSIVATDQLIRVDTGVVLRISDAFLVGDLGSRKDREGGWLDRLIGVVLLVLSLPLWLLGLAGAALTGGGKLMQSRELLGNRMAGPETGEPGPKVFNARQFNTGIVVLRNTPMLLSVVSGDLRLVGVSPLTPGESAARSEDWQMVRDQAPVGLLGPTQLNLSTTAPLEERLLSDAFFVREQGWARSVGYLLEGLKQLLTGEAWRRCR